MRSTTRRQQTTTTSSLAHLVDVQPLTLSAVARAGNKLEPGGHRYRACAVTTKSDQMGRTIVRLDRDHSADARDGVHSSVDVVDVADGEFPLDVMGGDLEPLLTIFF